MATEKSSVSLYGKVDPALVDDAKELYKSNEDLKLDNTLTPSYLKRLTYWASFMSEERSKQDYRVNLAVKLAKKNKGTNKASQKEKYLYKLVIEAAGGKDNLLKNAVGASAKAVAENVKSNLEDKGMIDKLTKDLTSLVVSEARGALNMTAGVLATAENNIMKSVGKFVDAKLQPIIEFGTDLYNNARNFVFDKIEGALAWASNSVENVLNGSPEKPNTVMSQESLNKLLGQAANEAIEKVVNTIQRDGSMVNSLSPVSGTDASNRSYALNPLEVSSNKALNITEFRNALSNEASAAVAYLSTTGVSMFEKAITREAKGYVVMSLMEEAKNRINSFNYITDILSYNATAGGLMKAADSYKPSSLLNSVLYKADWNIFGNNSPVSEVSGDITKLMSVNTPSKTDQAVNDIYNKLGLDKISDRTASDGLSPRALSMFKEMKNKGKSVADLYFELRVKAADDPTVTQMSTLGNRLFTAANKTALANSGGFVSVGHINPMNKNSTKEVDKLIRQMSDHLSLYEPDADESKAYARNSLSPKALWGDMREPRANGGVDVYGLNSLVKSFRINKYIPSGEVDYFQNGFSHIFFIKPDLNLTQNAISAMDMSMNPMLGDIISNLNYDNLQLRPYWNNFPEPSADYARSNPYVSYLLSNMLEGVPVTDIVLETKEGYENLKGFRMPFGLTHYKNTWSGEISVTYKDTQNLLITNIFKTWVKYISVMKEGIAECRPKIINQYNLDYLGAIYGFITAPDGQSILHWFRYTGVFPTNVPFSAISTSRSSQDVPEFSVNLKYLICEDNDVNILKDFNYVMNGGPRAIIPGASEYSNKQYFNLASIPTANEYMPLSDMTLKSGVFPNENHAHVMCLYNEDVGMPKNQRYTMSENNAASSAYRFILRYDSTDDFQHTLVGESSTNVNMDNVNINVTNPAINNIAKG